MTIAETVDLSEILKIAEQAECLEEENPIKNEVNGKQKVHVAVARDEAFCFYYKENMKLLEQAGCELVPISVLLEG